MDDETSEARKQTVSSKRGINATKKLPGEAFKRPWPPRIKMEAAVKAKVEKRLTAKGKTFLDSPLAGGSKPSAI